MNEDDKALRYVNGKPARWVEGCLTWLGVVIIIAVLVGTLWLYLSY